MYTVYILYSASFDKIYIGYTSNLIQRFHSHNELSNEGWTTRYRPWVVIYCEWYNVKEDAMKREKELKGGQGRQWIRDKIATEYYQAGFISA